MKHLKKSVLASLLLLSLFFTMTYTYASHEIKVMALFTDKAMVTIDGKQKLLRKGKTYRGVTLISSNSEELVLELHGEQKKYKLGSQIATSYKKPDPGKELVVWKDLNNMFQLHGSINGSSVKFLIDTGASSIALSSREAKKIGLKYKKGARMQASTASGIAAGYLINLDRVKVGHILVYNVEAMVLEGSFPTEVLLGQTFLERVHMTRNGDKMILRKKF